MNPNALINIITSVAAQVLQSTVNNNPTVPTELPRPVVNQAAKEIAQEVAKVPEIQHVTNTETAWYQQRSKWAAIFAGLTAVTGALATSGALPEAYVGYATGTTTVLSMIGGFFGLRAGQATTPLFSK